MLKLVHLSENIIHINSIHNTNNVYKKIVILIIISTLFSQSSGYHLSPDTFEIQMYISALICSL